MKQVAVQTLIPTENPNLQFQIMSSGCSQLQIMSSCRSIPTEDRISDLPESILCHILSFLQTKAAATTMILSKRWKPVWLSVLILNFDDKEFNDFETFHKFVYSTMFSLRDKKTSIQSFTLKLCFYSRFKPRELNRIFKFVVQRGVKNLNFDLSGKPRCIKLPPCILSCKTLQVLRLENVKLWDFDQVNFPCLKTLHLNNVDLTSPKYFAKFLYGCPILEDLNAKSRTFQKSIDPMENLNALPNLVKVKICYNTDIPMSLVCKTRILHIEQIWGMTWKPLPMFHNLTHMELTFLISLLKRECRSLIEILPHFPNLQHFNIKLNFMNIRGATYICSECSKVVPPNPTVAPECLSSQLKTLSIKCSTDTKNINNCEFQFVKYIMQHSKVLETVRVKSTRLKTNQMFMKLSSCTRRSPTCKLLFG
ncbi:putative FBD-associated F-box protein At5g44940 [Vicia villosa]|uniref:putative FBD-associated F-box protein At5g44940 n=1 Tax=Vicia villosa TaxID=3911 RepID=UPI00273CEA4F|nr:putative FBD-associated F-box protein At5g44940 [Vicia villosa]